MYTKERFTKELKIGDFLAGYFDDALTLERCRACPGFAKTNFQQGNADTGKKHP